MLCERHALHIHQRRRRGSDYDDDEEVDEEWQQSSKAMKRTTKFIDLVVAWSRTPGLLLVSLKPILRTSSLRPYARRFHPCGCVVPFTFPLHFILWFGCSESDICDSAQLIVCNSQDIYSPSLHCLPFSPSSVGWFIPAAFFGHSIPFARLHHTFHLFASGSAVNWTNHILSHWDGYRSGMCFFVLFHWLLIGHFALSSTYFSLMVN